MTIQYASDFHFEVSDNMSALKCPPIIPVGDVLVLAGDVFVLGEESALFHDFVEWCSSHFKHTFIVPGNHEFYGGFDIALSLHEWQLWLCDNVSVINNKCVVVDDVEFFFSTLWSNVPASCEELVNRYMPECRLALLDGQPLRAHNYSALHAVCTGWLSDALAASQAAHKVVVTHHCPVRIEDPAYENNGLSTAFVNAMEDYVAACGADAWIFGHTHYNGARGMVLGRTVLGVNQLGYLSQGVCKGFDPECVIQF